MNVQAGTNLTRCKKQKKMLLERKMSGGSGQMNMFVML